MIRTLLASLALIAAPVAAALAATPVKAFDPPASSPLGDVSGLGQRLFAESCAACHDAGMDRAPHSVVLREMAPEAILRALTDGVMREQGSAYTPDERKAIAEWVAGQPLGSAREQAVARCTGPAARFDPDEPPILPGWGFAPDNSHALTTAQAGMDRSSVARLKLKWTFAFPGATRVRSQPSLAAGALFTGSQSGAVHALDRETGCVRWTYEAEAEVRTAVLLTPWRKGDGTARPLALFGDVRANAYALDALTGAQVWKVRLDEHPAARVTGTPALHDGALYVPLASLDEAAASSPGYVCCTFRGSIVALDAATGRELWRTWLVEEPVRQLIDANGNPRMGPSGGPVWNAPAIDPVRGLLFVGTGNNYSNPATENSSAILALDMKTGAIRWRYQATTGDAWNVACMANVSGNCPDDEGPDFDFGAGTVLAKDAQGRDLVLAGQKSGIAYALDPDSGALIWQTRVGRGGAGGGIQFGIAASAGRLFAAVTDTRVGGEDESEGYP
ncbi:MAG TPA: PQQ-binding-like beta-propeller repeat protein, partial [Novosphingobium sp.]|nr:PQQ-binding-like beta-propeller repeat protein [Novosphingobium sp.]